MINRWMTPKEELAKQLAMPPINELHEHFVQDCSEQPLRCKELRQIYYDMFGVDINERQS